MKDGYDITARERWAETRRGMEARDERHTPDGRHPKRQWAVFKLAMEAFGLFLLTIGLYRRGVRNARDIGLTRLELAFDDLPAAFDGYTILHLTDLHFDGLADTADLTVALIDGLDVDLCAMTGDYRFRVHGPVDPLGPQFRRLAAAVKARDGIFATLGNHDTADMAAVMESTGITVLNNQTHTLVRQGDAVHLTGIDDVHYYYTIEADAALVEGGEGFRIVLVHSPEFAGHAAAAGAALYLTGHTHGGQVCLPGGWPVITHAGKWRRYARGLWRHRGMTGYTSNGVGVSGQPVRFNNRGEVTLITLRRKAASVPR